MCVFFKMPATEEVGRERSDLDGLGKRVCARVGSARDEHPGGVSQERGVLADRGLGAAARDFGCVDDCRHPA